MKSAKPETVLVTGGLGYIGSHVVRQLSEKGYEVIVLDNLSTGFRDARLHNEILYEGDAGDEDLLTQIFAKYAITAILHFAAAVRVEESVADPLKYYANNTMSTLHLINAAVRHKVPRFVFSSTAAVYGQPDRQPVDEMAPLMPESPYGASKMMSERFLTDLPAAMGLRFVILRYFNVAGADPAGRLGQRTPNATHLIKVACEVATGKRSKFTIFGTDYPTPDGTCVRDYMHVEDLAAAHLAALSYLEAREPSIVLNCGYGTGSSVREVIAAVQDVSGVAFAVEEGPRRPGDVASVIASTELVRKTLGWQPRFADLHTIVKHAWAWEAGLRKKSNYLSHTPRII